MQFNRNICKILT